MYSTLSDSSFQHYLAFHFQISELSKHLLDICNLADVERKLELYKAMFYQNIPSYRDTNFITSESLKIELIAGGLNWKQQDFIMEKMEPNVMGEVLTFLQRGFLSKSYC